MNELSSLGLILLLALLAGHMVQFLRIPEVTGYILAGIALGPSVLGWVSHDNLQALEVFSEVAIGLILFSVGSVFHYVRFMRSGRQVIVLTFIESSAAAILVSVGTVVIGHSWQVAALLGSVSMATAPASTLMVIRECNSRGPLSEMLMGIIAMNNILCLIAYMVVTAMIDLGAGVGVMGFELDSIYAATFPLAWQVLGSVALGFLVGLMLAAWATKVSEQGEMLILLAGSVLLCVGVARILDLSPLIASLAVGATMVNLSARSRRLFDTLSRTDPPFYAIFFVIAGADLDLSLVPAMGMLGAYYLAARAAGKFFGARLGSRWLGLDPMIQKYLGLTLMAQAGLAVGLTLTISRRFPEYATLVTTVVLSSVVIYEMFGPVATKFAIQRAGESNPSDPEPAVFAD